MKTVNGIQHFYKLSPFYGGLLYAWFPSMHTRVDIILCSRQSEEELMSVADAVYKMLHRLEKMASYYDVNSELAVLNRLAAIHPQVVSEELYGMLAFCIESYTRTFGCFDVTVHSANYTPGVIQHIKLSPQEHTLFFAKSGVTINLSGFLKGYALEKIRELLKNYGIENALINMGNSSVLALGSHPFTDGEGWKVSFGQLLERKDDQGVLLQNECLTTSGNNSYERKHIINPRDGGLVEGKRELAVVTGNGSIGEVLSTSLFVCDAYQRTLLETEFQPRLILDL